MASEAEIATWRQVTGLNVTDVRTLPPHDEPTFYVDGVPLTPSDRTELQIDGAWPTHEANGVYTVTQIEP